MVSLLPLTFLLLATVSDDPPPAAAPAPAAIDVVAALENVLADAIAKAEDSVVAIARDKSPSGETLAIRGSNPTPPPRATIPDEFRGLPRGFIFQATPEAPETLSFDFGSGVVVGNQGEILTAFHVVQGARRLVVKATGRQEFEAELIASDPRSDLAVIRPREVGLPAPRLKPIALGDASKLRKGSFLLALGNPFNAARDGKASAGWGILANIARKIDPKTEDPLAQFHLYNYPTLLQLDSKLNQGMSGGAVINTRGELVGLTTTAANVGGFDAQAGYAVPLDRLGRRIVESLVKGREAEYGYLGIRMGDDRSNRIEAALPGTPAAEGGLMVEDQVVSVGGLRVTDGDTLITAVNAFPPGVPVEVQVVRQGKPLKKVVHLAKLPTVKGEIIAVNAPKPWMGMKIDYISMLPNTEFGTRLLAASARGGVGILSVAPGSPADDAGIRSGSVLIAIAGKKVTRPDEFHDAAKGLKGEVEILLEGDRLVKLAIPEPEPDAPPPAP